MIASLEEVKGYLRVDTDEDDTLITMCIDAATEYIRVRIKRDFTVWEIPSTVKWSLFMIVSEFYENRTVNSSIKSESTVNALIEPYALGRL